jgi:hypothetical protein
MGTNVTMERTPEEIEEARQAPIGENRTERMADRPPLADRERWPAPEAPVDDTAPDVVEPALITDV